MIMNVLRGQIISLMSGCNVSRSPFLRRYSGKSHLFISDLPLCTSAEELTGFSIKAMGNGWNVTAENDYIYLDPLNMPALPRIARTDFSEEEECCLFLLSKHRSDEMSYTEIIEYLKASEQESSKKTALLLQWRKMWAERIRMHQKLPGDDLYEVILFDR